MFTPLDQVRVALQYQPPHLGRRAVAPHTLFLEYGQNVAVEIGWRRWRFHLLRESDASRDASPEQKPADTPARYRSSNPTSWMDFPKSVSQSLTASKSLLTTFQRPIYST